MDLVLANLPEGGAAVPVSARVEWDLLQLRQVILQTLVGTVLHLLWWQAGVVAYEDGSGQVSSSNDDVIIHQLSIGEVTRPTAGECS